MDASEELEVLKKNYILKTLAHLKALESLTVDDLRNAEIKAEVALRQLESSTSFMDLCVFILSLK